jgi:predicted RNA-binding Zn-ribbon protein involved in translation (DUF1610 family)
VNSRERIAYLRGLLDFMPKEEKETKVYSAIVDALAALAAELGEHAKLLELQREDYNSLADEVDDLHGTLYQLEESLGIEEEEDDESGVYEEEEDEELQEMAESYVSMTCPACAYSFYYKYEEGKEDGKLICPSCGEEFSRGGTP